MKTRAELIELLQPLLDEETRWLKENDYHEGYSPSRANELRLVIDALKEPDPKVISLLRAINTLDESVKGYEKTLHLMAGNINKARRRLVEDANYNEAIDDLVEANIKGVMENVD